MTLFPQKHFHERRAECPMKPQFSCFFSSKQRLSNSFEDKFLTCRSHSNAVQHIPKISTAVGGSRGQHVI